MKNEPISSTAHYPHYSVCKRREGGRRWRDGGSINGEEAERQYCKSGGKKPVVLECGGVTEREE